MNYQTIPYEIRRANLILLIDTLDAGNQSAFARRVGIAQTYIARLLYTYAKSGHKLLGEETALKITLAVGLPYGGLDAPLTAKQLAALPKGTP
jgi:hypothetical protein